MTLLLTMAAGLSYISLNVYIVYKYVAGANCMAYMSGAEMTPFGSWGRVAH